MIERDYLIIGAGAAGVSAVEGIRQYDKKGSVTLVGNETYLPYKRDLLAQECLTSKTLDISKIFIHPESWYQSRKVDLRLGCIVRELNIERRLAVLSNGQTIHFNKACLATGSRPLKPPVGGANLGNIIYLRTINDVIALQEMLAVQKNVLVVGGGRTALEAASALAMAKHSVSLLHQDTTLWQSYLDDETSQWLTEYFRKNGVTLYLQENLNGFEGKTVIRNIQTKSGNRYNIGLALVALGGEMNLELVRNTPLYSPKGSPVNDFLETDEKGIYAAGDIALYPDRIFGGTNRVDHWHNAVAQGLLVGANMTGKKRQRYEFLPEWEYMIFKMHWQFVGDFVNPPTRFEIEGSREKENFILRFYQGDRLQNAVLVNQPEAKLEAIKKQIRADYGKK